MMDSQATATSGRWIDVVRAGRDPVVQRLWNRYFQRLVCLAARQIGPNHHIQGDDGEAAVDVLHALCRGARAGRLDTSDDADDLWRLIVATAARKANTGESARDIGPAEPTAEPATLVARFLETEPSALFLRCLQAEYESLLERLPDGRLRRVAQYRLDGLRPAEIAERLAVPIRQVQWKLKLIHDAWSLALDPTGIT